MRQIKAIIIVLLLLSDIGAASPLGDWLNRITQTPQQQQDAPAPIAVPVADRWATLSNDLLALNTPANIQALSAYMEPYNVRSVRVDVIDVQHSFYVVPGYGLYLQCSGCVNEASVRLTEGQVREIMTMAQDGDITMFEKFRIWRMIKGWN